MTSLQIPEHVVLNETVRMQCNFNLDKELLYSVKWYKDGHEFYRYVPRDAPTVLTFPVPGVNVNVSTRDPRGPGNALLGASVYCGRKYLDSILSKSRRARIGRFLNATVFFFFFSCARTEETIFLDICC